MNKKICAVAILFIAIFGNTVYSQEYPAQGSNCGSEGAKDHRDIDEVWDGVNTWDADFVCAQGVWEECQYYGGVGKAVESTTGINYCCVTTRITADKNTWVTGMYGNKVCCPGGLVDCMESTGGQMCGNYCCSADDSGFFSWKEGSCGASEADHDGVPDDGTDKCPNTHNGDISAMEGVNFLGCSCFQCENSPDVAPGDRQACKDEKTGCDIHTCRNAHYDIGEQDVDCGGDSCPNIDCQGKCRHVNVPFHRSNSPLNFIIVGDGYSTEDLTEWNNAVRLIMDEIMGAPALVDIDTDVFAFYQVNAFEDIDSFDSGYVPTMRDKADMCNSFSGENSYYIYMNKNVAGRSFAHRGDGFALYSNAIEDHKVILHEWGHAVAFLVDEYFEESKKGWEWRKYAINCCNPEQETCVYDEPDFKWRQWISYDVSDFHYCFYSDAYIRPTRESLMQDVHMFDVDTFYFNEPSMVYVRQSTLPDRTIKFRCEDDEHWTECMDN